MPQLSYIPSPEGRTGLEKALSGITGIIALAEHTKDREFQLQKQALDLQTSQAQLQAMQLAQEQSRFGLEQAKAEAPLHTQLMQSQADLAKTQLFGQQVQNVYLPGILENQLATSKFDRSVTQFKIDAAKEEMQYNRTLHQQQQQDREAFLKVAPFIGQQAARNAGFTDPRVVEQLGSAMTPDLLNVLIGQQNVNMQRELQTKELGLRTIQIQQEQIRTSFSALMDPTVDPEVKMAARVNLEIAMPGSTAKTLPDNLSPNEAVDILGQAIENRDAFAAVGLYNSMVSKNAQLDIPVRYEDVVVGQKNEIGPDGKAIRVNETRREPVQHPEILLPQLKRIYETRLNPPKKSAATTQPTTQPVVQPAPQQIAQASRPLGLAETASNVLTGELQGSPVYGGKYINGVTYQAVKVNGKTLPVTSPTIPFDTSNLPENHPFKSLGEQQIPNDEYAKLPKGTEYWNPVTKKVEVKE